MQILSRIHYICLEICLTLDLQDTLETSSLCPAQPHAHQQTKRGGGMSPS